MEHFLLLIHVKIARKALSEDLNKLSQLRQEAWEKEGSGVLQAYV